MCDVVYLNRPYPPTNLPTFFLLSLVTEAGGLLGRYALTYDTRTLCSDLRFLFGFTVVSGRILVVASALSHILELHALLGDLVE